ncbi:MAG: clostripain-related cysteine peptidase [bacterium]|nr:clostripain-related cysteine peptidase [bacterium]
MKRKIGLLLILGMLLAGYMSFSPSDNDVIAQGGTGKCDEFGVEADFCETIDNENPFWEYAFRVRNRGSLIQIDISHIIQDSELDTYLYLIDSAGNIVAENDDRARGDVTSYIEYPQAGAGVYRVIAGRYGLDEGDTFGDFKLTIRLVPPAELTIADIPYRVTDGGLLDTGYPLYDEPRPKAKWTILAYYGGDNNLEPGLINDFHEFELAGGSNDDVRIIALLDRSPEYDESNDNWVGARLYEVQGGVTSDAFPPTLSSEAITDLGDINTGDGEALAQFLVWGMRYYPAENYVVSLGSHGAGWQGLITDDTWDKDIMTVPELRQAFSLAIEEAKVQNPDFDKFAFLINDACLMSSVEFFALTKDYFNYALASPEIVVDPAHDMALFTTYMNENQATPDFSVVGQDLVDKYIQQDILLREGSGTEYLTSVVTNLRRFGDLEAAVEAFALVVNAKPEVRSFTIGQARSNAYVYTNFANSNTKIDLGSFMQRVIATAPDDTELVDAANKVLEELKNVVVYADAGEKVKDRIYYYNVFFPEKSKDFSQDYFYQTPLGEWSRMLRNYFAAVTPKPWTGDPPFHSPIAPKLNVVARYPTEAVSILNPFLIEAEAIGRNIAYGEFTVDQLQEDGTITRMFNQRLLTPTVDENGNFVRINEWNQGITTYLYNWTAALPLVTDGTNSHFEFLNIGEDIAALDGRYRLPDSQNWNEVTVTMSYDGIIGGTTQRVINKSDGNSALAVIEIPVGAIFQTYKYLVTEDGRVSAVEGNEYVWPEGGLSWEDRPAPDGNYNAGILITAFGGTTGFVKEQVTVVNSELPADLRADTRPDVGVSIPRPQTWTPLSFNPSFAVNPDYGDIGVFQTSDPENGNVVALLFSFPTTDLAEAVLTASQLNVFTVVSELTPVTVSGRDGLQFDYTRQIGDESRSGRAFVVLQEYAPGEYFGIVLASESVDGKGNFEDFYPTLLEYASFFDSLGYNNSKVPLWIDNSLTGEESYYLPISWQKSLTEEVTDENVAPTYGVWTRYIPTDEPESAFLAMARYYLATEVENGVNVLSNIVTGQALVGSDSLQVIQNRTYNGRYHTWDATIYRVVREGVAYIGRAYATTVYGTTYALWAEVIEDDNTDSVYTDFIEPVIDGYQIFIEPPAEPEPQAESTPES